MAARPWCLLITLALPGLACATAGGEGESSRPAPPTGGTVESSATLTPALAGKRCHDGVCVCRGPHDAAEETPPLAGFKRIEIRLSAANGKVALELPGLGRFEHGSPDEACFYLDLPVSKAQPFHLDAQGNARTTGVTPHLHISEYGPAGPYWYDILDVACGAGTRGCDPSLAREWGQSWLTNRKRGRLDACGSIVVTGLKWYSSGGEAPENGGLLRDFLVDFSLEVKKFATEFPPGAAECKIGH
jgi:hypothetical protein